MILEDSLDGLPLMAVWRSLADAPKTELNNNPAAVGIMSTRV